MSPKNRQRGPRNNFAGIHFSAAGCPLEGALLRGPEMKLRLLVLTEIIAPYRIPVFNALARQKGIDLHVVFLAESDPGLRDWLVYRNEIGFSYQVLPSWRR